MENDPYWMQRAFQMARWAVGGSEPNPAVGALLLDPNTKEILGKGFTQEPGKAHAEIQAIEQALSRYPRERLQTSRLYVTLEPCTHYGRTPPCSLAIQQHGIKEVVIGNLDPNPQVNGSSLPFFKASGIHADVLDAESFRDETFWTLGSFMHRIKTNRPHISLKWAQTPEGFLAPESGPSGAVSGTCSHEIMHRMRYFFHAVMATPGTIATDYPRLDSRPGKCSLNDLTGTSFLSRLLKTFDEEKPQGYYSIPNERWYMTSTQGINRDQFNKSISCCPGKVKTFTPETEGYSNSLAENFFFSDIEHLFKKVAEQDVNQVMIEAGPTMSQVLLEKNIIDSIVVFQGKNSLWNRGRGNDFSFSIASGNTPKEWELREKILHQDADVSIFTRKIK